MAMGFNRRGGPSGAALSGAGAEFCLSGPRCHNEHPELRPTRLSNDGDALSLATGICGYCRKAGVTAAHLPSPPPTSGSVLITPPDEAEATATPEPDFDPSEFENFDPEAYEEEKKKELDAASESDGGDFMAQMKSAKADEEALAEKERKPQGETPTAGAEAATPADASGKRKRKPRSGAAAPAPRKRKAKEPAAAEIATTEAPAQKPAAAPKPSPKVEPREEPKPAAAKPAAPKPPAPVTKLPVKPAAAATRPLRAVGAGRTVLRDAAPAEGRLYRILDRLPVKTQPVTVFTPPPEEDPSQSDIPDDFRDGNNRPRPSILRRAWVGATESVRGALDVSAALGRLVLGPIGLLGVSLAVGLMLPQAILRMNLFGAAGILRRGIRSMTSCMKFTLKPLTDGRAIPAASMVLTTVAAVLAPVGSPAIATAAIALGLGGTAGWVVWRGARGAITGSRLHGISRNWNKGWTDTKDMSTQEVARLNDAFEGAVAEAFSELGFKTKLNGTQQARANGHQGSGDGGVDVFLKDPKAAIKFRDSTSRIIVIDSSGRPSVVSCKRYASPVGVKEVRDIFSVSKSEGFEGTRAVLVTTVGFTQPAIEFGRRNNVLLLTYGALKQEASKHSA